MPEVVLGLVAAAKALFAIPVLGGMIKFAAVSFGLGLLQRALSPRPKQGISPPEMVRTVMVRSSIEPRRIVYGTQIVSGVLTDAFVTGDSNQFLHLVVVLSGHEVDSIGDVYFNDTISSDSKFSWRDNFTAVANLGGSPNKVQLMGFTSGHPVQVGDSITVSNSVSYNGTYTVIAKSDRSMDIEHAVTGTESGTAELSTYFYRISKHTGGYYQAVDSDLDSDVAEVTTAHRKRGCAYIYVRLRWDANIWTSGIPNIKAVVTGKKLWDPRVTPATILTSSEGDGTYTTIETSAAHGLSANDVIFITGHSGSDPDIDGYYTVYDAPASTTFRIDVDVQNSAGGTGGSAYLCAYSNNAALVQLDYLVDKTLGMGEKSDYVDTTSWTAAANICEEQVLIDDTSSSGADIYQDRYTADGVVFVNSTPRSVMEDLLSASAGSLVYQGGVWKNYSGAWTVATVSLDEDDLRDSIEVVTRPGMGSLFNAVKGVFVDEDNYYQQADFPPVTNAAYEAQDGDLRIYKDLRLPFTTNVIRAQRLAKITLERARQSIIVTYPAKLTAWQLAAYDMVQISNDLLGWTNKNFRVLRWVLTEDGGVDLTLQEEASTVYNWNAGEETTIDAAPNTSLPDPWTVAAPSGIVLVANDEEVVPTGSGTGYGQVTVSWTAMTDMYVKSGGFVEVEYRKSAVAETDWLPGGRARGEATSVRLQGIEHNVDYDVRARATNQIGAKSVWTYLEDQLVQYDADLFTVAAPQNLTLSSTASDVIVKSRVGAWVRIHAMWTVSSNPYVTSGGRVEIQWRPDTSAAESWLDASSVSGGATETYLGGKDIDDDTDYEVRVRFVNSMAMAGSWSTQTVTTYSFKRYGETEITTEMETTNRLPVAFLPHQQATPDMTVRLEAGSIQHGPTLVEKAAQTRSGFTSPGAGNARIDRVMVDVVDGVAYRIAGTPVVLPAAPSAPTMYSGHLPVCQILFSGEVTEITNDMITDERPAFIGVVDSQLWNFSDGDATPSVAKKTFFQTQNTASAGVTITMFDDGVVGQRIWVLIGDDLTTIDFTGTNLKGNGGVDWNPSDGDHMVCIFDGTDWYCNVSDNTL